MSSTWNASSSSRRRQALQMPRPTRLADILLSLQQDIETHDDINNSTMNTRIENDGVHGAAGEEEIDGDDDKYEIVPNPHKRQREFSCLAVGLIRRNLIRKRTRTIAEASATFATKNTSTIEKTVEAETKPTTDSIKSETNDTDTTSKQDSTSPPTAAPTPPSTDTSLVDRNKKIYLTSLEHLQAQKEACIKADKEQWKNLQDQMNKIRNLQKTYLHGLATVSKLQDLRDAPDAIMPGNFVESAN